MSRTSPFLVLATNKHSCQILIPRSRTIEEQLSQWLEQYGQATLLLVPLLAFAEACIGVGIFVSGALLLALSVFLYSNDVGSTVSIASLAFIGAAAGDHFGYYCGYLLGPRLTQSSLGQRYRSQILRAEGFVRKYGGAAIVIGRFIPALRSILPAVVGVSGYSRLRYSIIDCLACLTWVIALAGLVMGIDGLVL